MSEIALAFYMFKGKDIKRSIGINTGYVGSTDWPLSEQDYQFLTQVVANSSII